MAIMTPDDCGLLGGYTRHSSLPKMRWRSRLGGLSDYNGRGLSLVVAASAA
jgi:hypothetical protein